MLDTLLILGVAFLIYNIGAPIFLLRRQHRIEKRLDDLVREFGAFAEDPGRFARSETLGAVEASEEDHAPEPEETDAVVSSTQWIPNAETPIEEEPVPDAEQQLVRSDVSHVPMVARRAPVSGRFAKPPARGVEEMLASTWLIWVGTLAVALSAVFLFRYAVDQGWLTPLARVVMGLLLGCALLAAGEWAARNPIKAMRRAMNPDYVPPALSGSGIFAVYVSLFAAHALYGLLSAEQAFVALGLTSYSALALSLRQGAFVALVGLAAGYLVPQLVVAPDPQALPLFIYLFVLTAGCLLVIVWRKWWWFAFLTIAGALIWPSLWLLNEWKVSDQGVLGAYALGLAVLFAVLSTSLNVKQSNVPLLRWIGDVIADTSGLGFVLSGLLLLWLAEAAGFNASAFTFIGLYAIAALGLSAWRASLEGLVVASALIAIAIALLFPEPLDVTPITEIESIKRAGVRLFTVPQEYRTYLNALLVFSAIFGFAGFLGVLRGRTPVVWAGIANLVPLLLTAIAYWRVGELEVDVSWAGLTATLAILATLAATGLVRKRKDRQDDIAIALFVAGATAALALAFACVLREAWLTVALSMEALALALIWSRMRLRELRMIATAVTLIVIVRLAANPMILDYEGSVFGVFGWVIYGYGIPAASNLVAARVFARSERDTVATLCEIAGVGFAFMMVALQLRLWTSGAIIGRDWRLFDQSVQTLWWLIAAALLLFEAHRGQRKWTYPAGLGLLVLSVASVFLAHVIEQSPLMTGEPVGRLPVLNLLGLAYALPAVLLFGMASYGALRLGSNARELLKYASGALILIYITLETRRLFWGTDIGLTSQTQPSDAEFYAYSAVWIAFALLLLALGILRQSGPLRYASLAVLMITVAKVFLLDMSDLTGLFRVASFLGLGLTLIGIGRVYQLYVFNSSRNTRDPTVHQTDPT